LGQPGDDQVAVGLAAADAMVDRIAGDRATPGLGQRTLPPLTAPGLPAAYVRQTSSVNAINARGEKP
jgi:hypothetical protein